MDYLKEKDLKSVEDWDPVDKHELDQTALEHQKEVLNCFGRSWHGQGKVSKLFQIRQFFEQTSLQSFKQTKVYTIAPSTWLST